MTNSTFVCIDAGKAGIIQFPEQYTGLNRVKWKLIGMITKPKVSWIW